MGQKAPLVHLPHRTRAKKKAGQKYSQQALQCIAIGEYGLGQRLTPSHRSRRKPGCESDRRTDQGSGQLATISQGVKLLVSSSKTK